MVEPMTLCVAMTKYKLKLSINFGEKVNNNIFPRQEIINVKARGGSRVSGNGVRKKHLLSENKGEVGTIELVYALLLFLLTVPRRCFFCGSFLLFMFRVCHAFLSDHCSLVITCWDRANLLAM